MESENEMRADDEADGASAGTEPGELGSFSVLHTAPTEEPGVVLRKRSHKPKSPPPARVSQSEVDNATARRAAFAVFAIILVLIASFVYIIPRLEVNIKVFYYESFGPSINIDSKMTNDGTVALEDFRINITVLDSSDQILETVEHVVGEAGAHSLHSFDTIHFKGDQYADYHILLEVTFKAWDKEYERTFSHVTDEPMRITYRHKITG